MEDQPELIPPREEHLFLLNSEKTFQSNPLSVTSKFPQIKLASKRTSCDFVINAREKYESENVSGSTKPRFAIVVLYGGAISSKGNNNSMAALSTHNKQFYADRHGYDLIDASNMIDHSRPVAWSKLLALKKYLIQYDYIMWIDTDTVIMNTDIKLEWIVNGDNSDAGDDQWDVLLSSDLHGPNVGTFIVRNSSWTTWFLDEWWQQEHLAQKNYIFKYEQRGIHYLLNTPQWRDQFVFGSPPMYDGDSIAIARHMKFVPQCVLNTYVFQLFSKNFVLYTLAMRLQEAQYLPGDFVVHFAGLTGHTKLNLFRQFYRRWEETESKRTT
eukprot:c4451_g1_i1.p1 GENE.c4451_g1_i1~~c4451_g1_i1.p1  ORF type:complete len:326 (-),score=61.76 c4451_g1_i1:158-1135(-)